jgi:hypothetical protein
MTNGRHRTISHRAPEHGMLANKVCISRAAIFAAADGCGFFRSADRGTRGPTSTPASPRTELVLLRPTAAEYCSAAATACAIGTDHGDYWTLNDTRLTGTFRLAGARRSTQQLP